MPKETGLVGQGEGNVDVSVLSPAASRAVLSAPVLRANVTFEHSFDPRLLALFRGFQIGHHGTLQRAIYG